MTEVDQWVRQIRADSRQRLEAISEMQSRLTGLTGEAVSRDGWVRVEATPTGMLTRLVIDDRALSGSGAELSATILETAARATGAAAEQMRAIVGGIIPGPDLEALLTGSVAPSDRAAVEDELRRLREEGR